MHLLQETRKLSKSNSSVRLLERPPELPDKQKENVDKQTVSAARRRSEEVNECCDERDALQVVRVASSRMEVDGGTTASLASPVSGRGRSVEAVEMMA